MMDYFAVLEPDMLPFSIQFIITGILSYFGVDQSGTSAILYYTYTLALRAQWMHQRLQIPVSEE